jgi:hypothetical protein
MSDRIAGKMCLCSDKDCAEDNAGDVTLIAAYSSIGRLKIIPTFCVRGPILLFLSITKPRAQNTRVEYIAVCLMSCMLNYLKTGR